MAVSRPDTRDPARRLLDEQLAAESKLVPPAQSEGAIPAPVEDHLRRLRRPVALLGIVENGLIRPLDPQVHLPERSRVIIVTSDTK